MKRLFAISIILISTVALCPAGAFAKVWKEVYKGKIAGKNVRVELYLDDTDYSVSGSYHYYDSKGKKLSSTLSLKGKCNPIDPRHNYYTLKETYNGKYCGSWDANFDCETGRLTGIFTSPKGKKFEIDLYQLE